MRRWWGVIGALALPGAAMAGVKYTTNGPSVAVPIVDNTAQPIAPWVQADSELPGNIVVDDVHDFLWTDFPAAAGRLQLRAVRSAKSGRIALYVGVTPAATSPNTPHEIAIFGFKQLDFDIGRRFGGEKTAPVTHVRSEQNQATKLYHLVFTFDTPLPKGQMIWLVLKTSATTMEPGTSVTFADNPDGLGHGTFAFVRGAGVPLVKPKFMPHSRR